MYEERLLKYGEKTMRKAHLSVSASEPAVMLTSTLGLRQGTEVFITAPIYRDTC
jgi:hypothetical protein